MIGDVNLFVKENEMGEEEGKPHVVQEGEIEVMIAGMPVVVPSVSLSYPTDRIGVSTQGPCTCSTLRIPTLCPYPSAAPKLSACGTN
jgi:hypothetical protein